MKINSLEISNILSIENATLTFGDSGLILVEGFDYDTGRANGAGKSSIFNALSFALYDKIPRRVTKSEILRNGTKSGWGQVEIQVGTRTYAVRRSRPTGCTYYIDGVVSAITQEEFEKAIGMNYDQFLITMYTAQDSDNKFIALNDSGKKNFILKIMNLDFTKYREDTAKGILKLEKEEDQVKAKIESLKSNVAIYKSNMVDSKDLDSQFLSCNNAITLAKAEIKKLEQVKEPDLTKYIEAETKMQTKLMDIKSSKILVEMKRTELHKLKHTSPDTNCPECNEDLNIINGKAFKVADFSKTKEQIKIVTQQIDNYESDAAQEPNVQNLLNQIKQKKQEEYKDFHEAQSGIATYKHSINMKEMIIRDLTTKLNKSNDNKDKIAEIISQAKALQARLNDIDTELVVLKSVENIFDATGAPAYIMDSIIDSFNESVTEYISEIWPNATYSLQTYKHNKDKTIKAKFSESLTINGKDRSIGSLSGGEIRALSLALDFSIIEVLGSKYSLSLNPIILDEPFNGLDSTGREMVIDILTKFAENRQVWVVDHAAESKALFNDIVRVEKRAGISKIV